MRTLQGKRQARPLGRLHSRLAGGGEARPELRRCCMLVVASLLLVAGCREVPASTSSKVDPAARIEPVPGSDLKRLVLTDKAVEQIGVVVVPVAQGPASPDGVERRVVPYSSLLYQADGTTLVYTNPAPLVFVRQPVTVESVQSDGVTLSAGPPAGTSVVSVGGAELLGVEFGVGK